MKKIVKHPEAARGVSPALSESHPEIGWSQMVGMRDRLIPSCFDVNLDIVWQTVHQDLPPLIGQLEKILGSETPRKQGSQVNRSCYPEIRMKLM
jgi:uncharacterized protein with HEPN domain